MGPVWFCYVKFREQMERNQKGKSRQGNKINVGNKFKFLLNFRFLCPGGEMDLMRVEMNCIGENEEEEKRRIIKGKDLGPNMSREDEQVCQSGLEQLEEEQCK